MRRPWLRSAVLIPWVRNHIYKSVGAQIEDPGDHGQEGVDRRGGARPLHHSQTPDGTGLNVCMYIPTLSMFYKGHLIRDEAKF